MYAFCNQHAHCHTCRTDPTWRAAVSHDFDTGGPEFECPEQITAETAPEPRREQQEIPPEIRALAQWSDLERAIMALPDGDSERGMTFLRGEQRLMQEAQDIERNCKGCNPEATAKAKVRYWLARHQPTLS